MADQTNKSEIGFLITHLGKSDNHLYQALTRLSSAVKDVSQQVTFPGWFEVPVDASGNAVPVISQGITQNIVATLSVLLANPTQLSQTSWILRFVQDATGGWELTFDTDYIGVADMALITEPNTRTMIHFTTRPDGKTEMNWISTGLAI